MTDLSETELQELIRLEAAATAGEWTVAIDPYGDRYIERLAIVGKHHDVLNTTCIDNDQRETNAALIAKSRNALPALLSELQRRRAGDAVRDAEREELGRLRDVLSEWIEADEVALVTDGLTERLRSNEAEGALRDAARRIAEQPNG